MPFARGAGVVEDAYAVLGLRRGASVAEVRAAWRRVARETHPDVGGDAVAFRTAREAYETLIDPERRAAHDRLLDARAAAGSDDATAPRSDAPEPDPAPDPTNVVMRVPVWMLILANVVTALQARDVLFGFPVRTPHRGAVGLPLPDSGLQLWVTLMNLLGLPWVFLVLAAFATAALVVEVVQGWYSEEPLLDGSRLVVARVLQMVAPVPLVLALAMSLVVMAFQLFLALLALAVVLACAWLLMLVLRD